MTISVAVGLAVVGCVGLLEWLKSFLAQFGLKLPGWVWSVVLLVLAQGCGFLTVYGSQTLAKTPLMAVLTGTVVLAFAQIGYDAIIKRISARCAEAENADNKKVA